MKLSITLKLFFALLVTSIIVIGTMAVAVRYSFQSGFLDYINKVEVERLATLATFIGKEYEKHGDWQFVKFKRGMWHRLITPHVHSVKGRLFSPANTGNEEIDKAEEKKKMSEPTLDFTDLGLRLALLDLDRTFVAGNRQFGSDAVLHPIFSQAETVGWLSITPSTVLTDTVDIHFNEQQNAAATLISIISVFFAAGLAVLLARNLLAPIGRLVVATRALTAGDFGIRIAVTSTDEMGQLQTDFNSLANTIEQNEHARRQWIADISHELRTPMAVLLGEVEAIQDGVRKPDVHNLKSLHAEIIRVNQLIDDLYQLSMSDIGALAYRKEDVELLGVIEEVITTFIERFRHKDIQLSVEFTECQSILIFADAQRLHQLFSNLLQNTLRYTDPGGRLEIHCEKNDSMVTVHWQDSKPGVSDDILKRLFERLFRADESRSREKGGAGLGLSISKNIVEAHDGEISAHHSTLGGLWFKITLPLASNRINKSNEQKIKRS
ncbi:MAG: HAMP domain-containing protein [Gammaproteobacteria bacterium]|nr:HAMP domain-containing protein [Gammaproteobacteria bacterium]